ncbi:MAG: precorrin-4 C(11)-methyltransferase [Candidatus Caldatribacteriaceae bacterium]
MIYFIGAGPGDPELLTIRGKNLLERCEVVIYAGSLVNRAVLQYAQRAIQFHNSAGLHLEAIVAIMEEAHRQGYSVARLHSGDPSIYGAIREQIEELKKRHIPFEVVPGVSSFQAAAARLGRELTVPGVAQTVILTRLGGRTPVPEKEQLRDLARHRATMVIFLSVDRLEQVVQDLSLGYPPDTPAAVVHRVTYQDEEVLWGTLGDIVEKVHGRSLIRQSLILVGEALGEQFLPSCLYNASFTHGFRKKP